MTDSDEVDEFMDRACCNAILVIKALEENTPTSRDAIAAIMVALITLAESSKISQSGVIKLLKLTYKATDEIIQQHLQGAEQ